MTAEKRKTYYFANREKILARNKEYTNQNPDKVKKNRRNYYLKHKIDCDTYTNISKQNRITNNKELLYNILKDNQCNKCQESNVYCLEFHHLRDKKNNVSTMIHAGYSWNTVLKEIEKCQILCRNCHRKTYIVEGSRECRKKKTKHIRDIKQNSRCQMCGYDECWAALDFHHTEEKTVSVASMISKKEYTLDDINKEIKKCILICANCHRKLHKSE